ncbi:MAG TPA: YncE family protein, partial [Longimicrobium sp.]|nr:YncE family protein [Longimicrobium sp.]
PGAQGMRPTLSAPSAADSARVTVLRADFVARGPDPSRRVREREPVELRVRLTDPATGRPATGLRPTAWVDVRRETNQPPLQQCRQKVATFNEASLHVKHGQISIVTPVEDLNGHYLMAMARSNAIAVIDPVKGFGRTRLFTAIALPSPGADWAATPGDGRVFVTSPDSGVVSVIDTHAWRVVRRIDAGRRPTRAAIDPSGRFVWITDESPARPAIAVVDAEAMSVARTLPVGAGPHAIAFSNDGALAFVTARAAGTVSIFDARTLARLAEVATGQAPVDVAWSAVRRAALVVNEGDGSVAVVDPATRAVAERIPFTPGIRAIRFGPAEAHGGHGAPAAGAAAHAAGPGHGRLAFVLNPRAGTLQIYDLEQKKVIRTLSGAPEPDQVAFTAQFAYVRAAGTPSVAMIPLANPMSGAIGPHDYFPAGNDVPGAIAGDSLGEVIISQPGMHDAIYVANPRERMIYSYHYMEGMPVPHGGLTTYGFTPRAIRTVSRQLREVEPGTYAATVRMDRPGEYELVLRNPEPYALGCHAFTVDVDPALRTAESVRVTPESRTMGVGKTKLRFRVMDTRAGTELQGLQDFQVQLAAPSGWQQRVPARAVGGGVYEAEFDIPAAGVYSAAYEIPSRGVGLRDGSAATFEARP